MDVIGLSNIDMRLKIELPGRSPIRQQIDADAVSKAVDHNGPTNQAVLGRAIKLRSQGRDGRVAKRDRERPGIPVVNL